MGEKHHPRWWWLDFWIHQLYFYPMVGRDYWIQNKPLLKHLFWLVVGPPMWNICSSNWVNIFPNFRFFFELKNRLGSRVNDRIPICNLQSWSTNQQQTFFKPFCWSFRHGKNDHPQSWLVNFPRSRHFRHGYRYPSWNETSEWKPLKIPMPGRPLFLSFWGPLAYFQGLTVCFGECNILQIIGASFFLGGPHECPWPAHAHTDVLHGTFQTQLIVNSEELSLLGAMMQFYM